jgi:hypothetical protein
LINSFTKNNTFAKSKKMTTIQINEKTKIGKNILEMLKALAKIENNNSIKILDETEYLLSTKANSEALMHGIKQVQEGKKGRTIKTSDLWK